MLVEDEEAPQWRTESDQINSRYLILKMEPLVEGEETL